MIPHTQAWMELRAYWISGGPLLTPMFFLCAGIWYHLHRQGRCLNRQLRLSQAEQNRLSRILQMKTAAPEMHSCWLLSGLHDALSRAQGGTQTLAHFKEFIFHIEKSLRRDQLILAAMTAISPMVGLLGTVFGMIQSFDMISNAGPSSMGNISSGISQALITTQFGLIIALPGVLGMVWLKKKGQRLIQSYRHAYLELRIHVHGLDQGGIS